MVFRLDAERAHYLTMGLLRAACAVPGGAALLRWAFRVRGERGVLGEPVEVAGIRFPNRVGLAAGFDKDARWLRELAVLGFGSVEVGTLTPRAQTGNPRPRLFRLVDDRAILNRMGFNNGGVDAAVARLRRRPPGLVVGGNIG